MAVPSSTGSPSTAEIRSDREKVPKFFLRAEEGFKHLKRKEAFSIANPEKATHRMKQLADKDRTERELNIGDWVSLRLRPYKLHSVKVQALAYLG